MRWSKRSWGVGAPFPSEQCLSPQRCLALMGGIYGLFVNHRLLSLANEELSGGHACGTAFGMLQSTHLLYRATLPHRFRQQLYIATGKVHQPRTLMRKSGALVVVTDADSVHSCRRHCH